MEQLHEECGVFGIYSPKSCDIAKTVYYGLFALQHRGQEGAGIVVNTDGVFSSRKDLGLVNEVFSPAALAALPQGSMAVGHVRYGTTGGNSRANCQPIEVNHIKGHLALAHNGNLTNAFELRQALELKGAIFHTTSDTETIAYLITRARLTAPSIEEAVVQAMPELVGAYSLILMSSQKLIALRDPLGFRPLCYGLRPDGSYVVASESCALDAVGANFVRDIGPGEVVVIDENGLRTVKPPVSPAPKSLCVFEYIYFARPDSVIDGNSVHLARQKTGEFLAKTYPVEADLVIGAPDSGLDAALGYSHASGIPYGIGFVKNKYVGRSFIAPNQADRTNTVKIKLNPISSVVAGKRIVLVDDSIVRGTTSRQTIALLRQAGAREVHMRVAAPPFRHACFYGVDVDSPENLVANHHTPAEIAALIGADSVGYVQPEQLCHLAAQMPGICTACFTGDYPTSVPSHTEKDRFEQKLSKK